MKLHLLWSLFFLNLNGCIILFLLQFEFGIISVKALTKFQVLLELIYAEVQFHCSFH